MMGMFVANTSSGGKVSFQVLLHGFLSGTFSPPNNDLYVVSIEDIHCSSTHSTTDNGVHTQFMEVVGQKPGR